MEQLEQLEQQNHRSRPRAYADEEWKRGVPAVPRTHPCPPYKGRERTHPCPPYRGRERTHPCPPYKGRGRGAAGRECSFCFLFFIFNLNKFYLLWQK